MTFVNAEAWDAVYVHAWDGTAAGTTWPGKQLTASGEKINGYDTYLFTFDEGAYAKCLFNCGGANPDACKTVDQVIDASKPYFSKGEWYASASDIPAKVADVWTVVGAKGLFATEWDFGNKAYDMAESGAGVFTLVVEDVALDATAYAYKFVQNRSWSGAQYPQQGDYSVTVPEAGTYTVTYTLDVNAGQGSCKLEKASTPDPEPEPDPTPDPEPEPEPDPTPDPEPEPEPDPTPDPEPDPTPDPEPAGTITINFANDEWTAASFYAWSDAGTISAAWPGDPMTKEGNVFTYELTLPEGTYSFIINNGGNGVQTVDTEGVAESTCFVLDENKAGKWTLAVSADCEAVEPKPVETSYVLMGVNGDWNTGIAMTPNPDNADEYVVMGQAISAATDAVKVVVFSAEGTIYCSTVKEGSAEYTQDGMQNIVLADGTYDFYYSISENAIYIGATLAPDPEPEPDPTPDPEPEPDPTPDPEPDPTPDPEPEPDPTPDPEPDPTPDPEPAGTITINFANDEWTAASFYAWSDAGTISAAWPGDPMTKEGNVFTYELTLPEGTYSFIINNGGNGVQTVDTEGVAESTCFVLDENKAGKWTLAVSADCEAVEPKPVETSYVLMGVNGDWNTGIAMTPNPDNADEYVVMGQAISAATDAVKVVVFSAEGTIYCSTVKEGSAEYTQDGMQNIVLADGTYDFYYSISENAIYIGATLAPDPEPEPDPTPDPEPEPDPTPDPEPEMLTLYYVNNQGWSSVNAYAWADAPIVAWPGEAATKTELTAKGYDVYSYTFDSSLAANIIFNGDGNQTADLVIDPSKPYFYIDQWYASLEDIEAISSIEELAAYNIYATNGTIYADCEFAIYNLGGIDVTAQNGSLEGNYVVKTQKGSLLISVW